MSDPHIDDNELNEFLGALVPGEVLRFDEQGRNRHRAVERIAPYPLSERYEAAANELATAIARADGLMGWRHRRNARGIGEQLGAEGGGFLMVLVAHRAQYLHDPDWRAKRDEFVAHARKTGAMIVLSAGGPLVSRIESEWDGLYGWQR